MLYRLDREGSKGGFYYSKVGVGLGASYPSKRGIVRIQQEMQEVGAQESRLYTFSSSDAYLPESHRHRRCFLTYCGDIYNGVSAQAPPPSGAISSSDDAHTYTFTLTAKHSKTSIHTRVITMT